MNFYKVREFPTMNTEEEYLTASSITSKIWNAVLTKDLFNSEKFALINNVFTNEELTNLYLPSDSEILNTKQNVALANGLNFERYESNKNLQTQYQKQSRTRIYESIHINSSGWFSLVNAQLTRLSRRNVVCSLYCSNALDKGLGVHSDLWDGLIFQIRGEKTWHIYDKKGIEKETIVLNSGDFLLLPEGVKHDVETKKYSEHITYAFQRKYIDNKK